MLATASLHRHFVVRNCLAVLEVHGVVWRHEFDRGRVGLLLDLWRIVVVHVGGLTVLLIICVLLIFLILLVVLKADFVDFWLEMPRLLLDLQARNRLCVLIRILGYLTVLCIMFALFFLVLKDAASLSVERELRAADLIVLELCHRFDLKLLARVIQLSHVVLSSGELRCSVMLILWAHNTLVCEFVAVELLENLALRIVLTRLAFLRALHVLNARVIFSAD